MTTRPTFQCAFCARLLIDPERTCAAYPDGIPDEIWWNRADHRRPYPGDGGVQWRANGDVEFPEWALRGVIRTSARSSPAARGRAVLSPYPEVREKLVEYLNLPPLPRAPWHLRYSDDQPRDENGRFGEGGGGSSGSKGSPGAARLHAGDEAAIKAAYEFDDDELTGLRTEVYAIRSAGPNQTTYVSAWIKNADGETVGQAEHAIHADQRTARLDGLILEPDYQGQGFGARYMRNVESQYREAGIEEITLTADIDVGGYSWARDGYNFKTADSRSTVASMAREESRRFNPDVQRQVRAVADDPEATPVEFAMIGWQEGATTWPGKQIMLGSLWEGSKKL